MHAAPPAPRAWRLAARPAFAPALWLSPAGSRAITVVMPVAVLLARQNAAQAAWSAAVLVSSYVVARFAYRQAAARSRPWALVWLDAASCVAITSLAAVLHAHFAVILALGVVLGLLRALADAVGEAARESLSALRPGRGDGADAPARMVAQPRSRAARWFRRGLALAVAGLALGGGAGWFTAAGMIWMVAMGLAGAAAAASAYLTSGRAAGQSSAQPCEDRPAVLEGEPIAAASAPPGVVAAQSAPPGVVAAQSAPPGVVAASPPAVGPAWLRRLRRAVAAYFAVLRARGPLAALVAAFAADLFAQAALVLVLPAWPVQLLAAPATVGIIGGAFVLGVLAASGVIEGGYQRMLAALVVFAAFIGGAALGMREQGAGGYVLVVAAAALVCGVVLASIGRSFDAQWGDLRGPDPGRARVLGGLSAGMGIAAGTLVGLWLAGLLTLFWSAVLAAALLAAGALAPVLGQRIGVRQWEWSDGELASSPIGLTLSYSFGKWSVEIFRGESVPARRHPVSPVEALRAVELLAVPGVREEIERIVADDRQLASAQAERLRAELADVGDRLAAMDQIAELRRAAGN